MKNGMTDAELGRLIGALPYYPAPDGFNARVMARLGLAEKPAPAPWLSWAEKAAGTIAACWLGAAGFAALVLIVSNADAVLAALAEPRAFAAGLKLAALKAGIFARDLLGYASIGQAVLLDKAGGFWLAPRLAAAALVSGSVIVTLSRRPAGAAR